MENTMFVHAALVLENGIVPDGYLITDATKIHILGAGVPPSEPAGTVVDCGGAYLAPGFIDGHTHGGGGADYMDGTEEAILTAARAHLRHGTTTVCPTTLTCSDEELFRFFDHYARAKSVTEGMPHLGGIHLEGPYFSPAQAGAQPPQYLRIPEPIHYEAILERAGRDIVRWSSAPELPGALELGDALARRGILASIGHTDASYGEILQAVRHGYTHMTHFYSAMSGMTRRDGFRILGAVESGYLLDELRIELIADGMHLPPELLRLILKCKPHASISLVTDSMRAAAMPEGLSTLGSLRDGVPVIVEGGIARMLDRSAFAGSVATADRLVRVMTQEAGLPLWEAVRMMSLHPAELLGMADRIGSLAPGKEADLVLFDEGIRIRQVYVSGRAMLPPSPEVSGGA